LIKRGKTTESDLQLNPTANPNPNPYLVAVRYGSLAKEDKTGVNTRVNTGDNT